jgi:hypothetical protein
MVGTILHGHRYDGTRAGLITARKMMIPPASRLR